MRGICPVCDGSLKFPGTERPCNNCGGQGMFGIATGVVPLRPDGTPCKHEYVGETRGRCYTVYTCKHCNHSYDIDSSD